MPIGYNSSPSTSASWLQKGQGGGGGGFFSSSFPLSLANQLFLLFVFATVAYSLIYTILYSSSVHSELYLLEASLKNATKEIQQLKQELNLQQRMQGIVQHKQNKLLVKVDPWERCMRFNHSKECDSDDESSAPCSINILKEMAFTITQALEEANVTHWISYGTMLGAIRNQSIIPWTADIDITLPQAEFKTVEQRLRKTKVLQKYGYLFFLDPVYPDIGRMCITDFSPKYAKWEKTEVEKVEYYNAGYPYVDIYTAVSKGNDIAVRFGPPCVFKQETIFPLQKVQLYDRMLWAPHNPTKYLTQLYGPNFMVPPSRMSAHGAYSQSCKKEWQDLEV